MGPCQSVPQFWKRRRVHPGGTGLTDHPVALTRSAIKGTPIPTNDSNATTRSNTELNPSATRAKSATRQPVQLPSVVAGNADTPPTSHEAQTATNDFVTVIPTNAEPNSTASDEADLAALREECPRFRILVIGRANAGKTTILQKTCNTTEEPIIRDVDGNELDRGVIEPTDGRGIHDINNELSFSTNEGLVFHDSPGFEAGSIQELKAVREFIARRAVTNTLTEQLHAIWYCLPTDNDRPLTSAEISFFEEGTGRVPVIAIFTKYDGMILKEYNRLRFEESCTKGQASALAPIYADDMFRNSKHYLKRLQGTPYPPARYLRVQAMHKPESDCANLTRQTIEALDNKKLQLLLVSVQQNNIGMSTSYAIRYQILRALKEPTASSTDLKDLIEPLKRLLWYYSHLATENRYNENNEVSLRGGFVSGGFFGEGQELPYVQIFQPVLPSLASQHSSSPQLLVLSTALLVVCEDSFWLKKSDQPMLETFKTVLDSYQASGKHSAVSAEVDRQFGGIGVQDLGEDDFVKRVEEIIKKFRDHQ